MKKNKTSFPFQISRPKDMTVLEQVVCMVWLADNKTLQELRKRQFLVTQQQKMAREQKLFGGANDDLRAMADNYAAAVAYQTWEDDLWLSFINV